MKDKAEEYIQKGHAATWDKVREELRAKAPNKHWYALNSLKRTMYQSEDLINVDRRFIPLHLDRGKARLELHELALYPKVLVKNPNCLKLVRIMLDPKGAVRNFIGDKLGHYGDAVYATIVNLPKYIIKRELIGFIQMASYALSLIYFPIAAPTVKGACYAFQIWSCLVGVTRTLVEMWVAGTMLAGDRKSMQGMS